jgi:glycosyltransferase involved in cell wall biosynthesis
VREVLSHAMAGLVTFLPLPNHVDAQPNKMFEYMSAGLPVIASHFPLWREIIEGNDCGLCVDPEQPAEIAAAIDRLVGDPTFARRLGDNSRAAVRRTYNWEAEQLKLIALYDRLPARRLRPRRSA